MDYKVPRVVNVFPRAPQCAADGNGVDLTSGRTDFDPIVRTQLSALSSDDLLDMDLHIKVIIVGDMSVGKTNLLMRFTDDNYSGVYKPTLNVDFKVRKYQVLDVPNMLCIWDTAGQEQFQALTRTFYKGAHACCICFDLSRKQTLTTTDKWIAEVLASTGSNIPCFLVGLKSDLLHEVSYSAAISQATRLGAEYWEISSKQNFNVSELFDRIAVVTFERHVLELIEANRKRRNTDVVSNLSRSSQRPLLSRCCRSGE